MTMGEMTTALRVYFKTYKVYGAEITYDTRTTCKGIVQLPSGEFDVDEFATRLEFTADRIPTVSLVDDTGCVIKEMNPINGRDMLLKLRQLIPPIRKGINIKASEILDLLRKILNTQTSIYKTPNH